MTMAATLPINHIFTGKTTGFFSLPQAWHCTNNMASQSRSSPWLGESSLVAEALAEVRGRHEERLHNNQPEWTAGTRGMQPEATARQESEAPADRRHRHDEATQQPAGQET